jgi:cell wall-associated NlpC family hydrolase
MKRLLPLLGAVLALAFSSSAAADTFRVEGHDAGGSKGTAFPRSSSVISFTESRGVTAGGGMSFAALRPIWEAAGNTYGIPWQVLAAINKVETNFGSNLGPSSAGAIGWMQFMPSTWARWGTDANGDGVADPDNPTDAIFSAARYLAACGGQFDIVRAVYCYNHASWYVNEVLGLAALYSRAGGGAGAQLFSSDALQTSLTSARKRVAASSTDLVAARARASKLAATERHLLHAAATASLLSDQLGARKDAVLLGVRRNAAEKVVERLRKRLHTATSQLGRLKDEAGGASFGTGGGLFTTPMTAGTGAFQVGGSFVPAGEYTGVVSIALQYLGVPYVWGGASPRTGFDCSGLVKYVFAQVGVSLPHNTVAQWNDPAGVPVSRNDLQPGDLVFFNGLDHVGIYIGNGALIDAPHTGASVEIDSLGESWFAAHYDGARRIVGTELGNLSGTTSFTTGNNASFTSDVVYFTH